MTVNECVKVIGQMSVGDLIVHVTEAQDWIADNFDGDTENCSWIDLLKAVQEHYDGGLSAFMASIEC